MLEPASVREFPPAPSKRLIWSYPIFRIDSEGVTEEWKPRTSTQAGGRASGDTRKEQANERARTCELALLAHMYSANVGDGGIAASEAAAICSKAIGTGITTTSLKGYVSASEWLDVYQPSAKRWFVVPHYLRRRDAQLL